MVRQYSFPLLLVMVDYYIGITLDTFIIYKLWRGGERYEQNLKEKGLL